MSAGGIWRNGCGKDGTGAHLVGQGVIGVSSSCASGQMKLWVREEFHLTFFTKAPVMFPGCWYLLRFAHAEPLLIKLKPETS